MSLMMVWKTLLPDGWDLGYLQQASSEPTAGEEMLCPEPVVYGRCFYVSEGT